MSHETQRSGFARETVNPFALVLLSGVNMFEHSVNVKGCSVNLRRSTVVAPQRRWPA